MNRIVPQTANQYIQAHERRKWWQIAVIVLASIVIFFTTYALIMPAVTQKGQTYCGKEEHKAHTEACFQSVRTLICGLSEEGHTHSDACYEEKEVLTCGKAETTGHLHSDACFKTETVLVCDNEEADHVHDASCYQEEKTLICGETECEPHQHDESCFTPERVLVCGLEEQEPHQHSDACYTEEINPDEPICGLEIHEHTLQCFSNPDADVETPAVWERSIEKAALTGNWSEDVLTIAATQLGYTESSANYQVGEDGVSKRGYTRYGDWYGIPYGDWCAMYCSFCLSYAEVDRTVFPWNAGCESWIEALSDPKIDLYHAAGTYTPKPGDLIFFDWDEFDPEHPENRSADHVGFVAELIYDEETNEPVKIKTIEGNWGNRVCNNYYSYDDDRIMGYGELPEASSENANGLSMLHMSFSGQTLGVAPYSSTYSPTQNMPAGATSTNVKNYWQVVSGYYGAIKSGTGTYTYDGQNNNAVRIQKAVIPTGSENQFQFQLYLNVEPQMSWEEFLKSLDNYQTHNNSSSFNPSSGCSQLLTPEQYAALPDRAGPDGQYKGLYTAFTVDYVDNSVSPAKHYKVTRYGNFTGRGKNAIQNVKNGSYCFSSEKFSYNGLQNSIDWPSLVKDPEKGLTVDISKLKEKFTFAEEPVYPKTVTDPMGKMIIYEGMVSYDGGSYEAPNADNGQVLTWTLPTVEYPSWPYYSTHTETGSVPGYPNFSAEVTYVDNVVPVMLNGKQTLYYTDVLEMRYMVSLDTSNPEFVSAAPLTNSPKNSIYPTNGTTTLDYVVGAASAKSVNFVVPTVRGLRWDIVVKKVDSSNRNLTLPGASFALYEAAEEADEGAVPVPGAANCYGILKNTIISGAEGLSPKAPVLVGKTYYLAETAAPQGYKKEEKPIAFSVVESNGVKSIRLITGEGFAANCVVGTTEDTTFNLIVSDTEKEHITPTPPPDPQYPTWNRDVTISKQIDYRKDNGAGDPEDLYRLYLSLESEAEPIDMLLVIDQSGSMTGKLKADDARSRQQIMLDFLNGDNGDGFIADFLDANEENDLAILTFGSDCSYSTERYIRHWGESGTTLSLPEPDGATNYTAALDIANDVWAEKKSSTNKKIMLFMSDGHPTLAYSDNQMHHSFAEGMTIGNGGNSYANIVTRANLFLLYCNYEADPTYMNITRKNFFDQGITDDEGNTTPRLRWYGGDGAGYPVMYDFLTANLNIPGIAGFPYGEIDEAVFRDWYKNSWMTWDNAQRLSWIENNMSYYGDSYDMMYQCEYAFYDFQTHNPDVKTYTIGYSDSTAEVYAGDRSADEVLQYMSGEDCFYQCSTASALEAALSNILTFGNVRMTDNLSTYAELAAEPELVITMKHGDEAVTLYENGAYTAYGEEYLDTGASPLNENGVLSVIFNPNVTFEKDFECTASFNIRPTAEAYSEFAATGYNAVGDRNTDYQDNRTSSGKDGFYSNGAASASWKTRNGAESEDFNKPVIQVHTVKLTVSKTVSGSNTDQKFQFEVSSADGFIMPPADGDGYTLDDNGTAHFELADGESAALQLQPGATVLVRETKHDGFNQTITKAGVPVSNADSYEFVIAADTALTVTNIAGYELPQTGGIGTTDFYLVGGVLVLVALELLISKKRAEDED